jgi:hypothetical protein
MTRNSPSSSTVESAFEESGTRTSAVPLFTKRKREHEVSPFDTSTAYFHPTRYIELREVLAEAGCETEIRSVPPGFQHGANERLRTEV